MTPQQAIEPIMKEINKLDDGGPAFPVPMVVVGGNVDDVDHKGLSLRDWFAGKAMMARIIALGTHEHVGTRSEAWAEMAKCKAETAERAYQQADAMLAERTKAYNEGKVKE